MGIDAKEKTTHNASVGSDAGQSIQKDSDNSIPASEAKGNGEMKNSTESLEEMYRRMQRMADLRYLHTLTMTELFQTSYKSRPSLKICSIREHTFWPARPRLASRFWWRRSPTMSAPSRSCGAAKSIRELYFTLRWRMISSASRTGCL